MSFAPAGRFPVLAAFASHRFRRVWFAGLVSQLGDWMQIIGRSFLVFEITGKAGSVGIVYFATFAPQLLLSLYGGVLADRLDRRRLLIVTQFIQAGGAIVLGLLVATDTATVANVAGISFVLGIGFVLAIPAQQALTPAVVDERQLSSAIQLTTTTSSVCRVFGPLLASFIIGAAGVEWVFWANAVSFLAVIVAWVFTHVDPQERLEENRSLDAMRVAAAYVRRTPAVAVSIGVTAVLMFVGMVYQPLAVVFATDVLADGSSSLGRSYFGWLQAALGVGAAVGILGLASSGRRHPGWTFTWTALGYCVALFAFAWCSSFGVALAVITLVGAFQFANMSLALTVVQHLVPDALRGRVMSIQMTGLVGLLPITGLVGGYLADRVGVQETIAGAAVICFVFSLMMLRWRRYLDVPDFEPDEAERRQTAAAVGALIEEEA